MLLSDNLQEFRSTVFLLKGSLMSILFRLILIFCSLFSSCAFSQESANKGQQQQNEIEQLKNEISKINEEMNNLRSEIQQLRKFIEKDSSTSSYNASPEDIPSQSTENRETGYWLSKSNKRHNSSCRYYKTPGGRPCRPTDGVACKLCGG